MLLLKTLLIVPALINLYLGLYGLFGPGVPLTQKTLIKGTKARWIALACLTSAGVIANILLG